MRRQLAITSEDTEFRFASDGTAWWTRADFEGDESLYNRGALSAAQNANTPMMVRLPGDLYVALHEADKPTGEERTYPNFMSHEARRGGLRRRDVHGRRRGRLRHAPDPGRPEPVPCHARRHACRGHGGRRRPGGPPPPGDPRGHGEPRGLRWPT
ncbi:glycoside hydrolase family 97 N-terminal domain-containing protein [Sorangium sp. So ce362]|uniref:glycoside hydrolase family 97 N-terminal domain-containing protein n=1 Tax=Sorangium sp. So ce362 TaxID=3133303 RepID=UPI003F5FDBED